MKAMHWKQRALTGGAAVGLLAVGAVVLSLGAPEAKSLVGVPEPVIWVEEDWAMIVNEPNDSLYAPQFHTIMSPNSDTVGNYAQVLWNYRETPDFTAGGIQLQSYAGDDLLRVRSVESRTLSTTAETITWTQGLWTDGSVLTFYIDNGMSSSWGTFGRDMRIDETATIANLNSYSPNTSVQNCRITYGANRVDSLMVTQVRYYGVSGLLAVDTTPRVVYQNSSLAAQ